MTLILLPLSKGLLFCRFHYLTNQKYRYGQGYKRLFLQFEITFHNLDGSGIFDLLDKTLSVESSPFDKRYELPLSQMVSVE